MCDVELFVHVSMMQLWMMFCPEVCVIHLAWSPVYSELLLTKVLGPLRIQNSNYPIRKNMEVLMPCFEGQILGGLSVHSCQQNVFLAIVSCDSQIGHSPVKIGCNRFFTIASAAPYLRLLTMFYDNIFDSKIVDNQCELLGCE